jgi:elongation factor Ts
MVKELRDITGAGMMECKKALTDTDGDVSAAIDVLRTRGLASLAKKAGRATNEGAIAATVSDDGKTGTLIEVNCETDFVGSNEVFTGFVGWLADMVNDNDPADVDALQALKCPDSGLTVEESFGDLVGKLGENMHVARFTRQTVDGDGAIATYIHGGAKIGIMVLFGLGNQATADNPAFKQYARDVAMQVAASDPIAVSRDDFDQEIIDHELSIYKAQAAESGKPESIQEKMAQGRLNKFFKEQALVEQPFVKDMDISVQQLTDNLAKEVADDISIKKFVRFNLGETAE